MPVIEPASLQHSPDGVPYSGRYDDIYHTAAGAIEQAEHVFLSGNGLPERWRDRERFTIVETGFGLGNNFLATWQAWRADPQAAAHLHFVSVEKHPFTAPDLAIALQASSAIASELRQALLAQWPLPLPGIHRLSFDDGRVVLTLGFGEGENLLERFAARADAIFLDGFAPAKNPDLWSDEVFRALAGLSDQHTTLATWSVSGAVREGLRQAGFEVDKAPGFGGKREMLQARYRGARHRATPPAHKDVLIIGAGLAGSAIAERLCARGFKAEILEARDDFAQGASGNLAGAFRPLPSKDDNFMSRITRAGFLYGRAHLDALEQSGHAVLHERCGVLHLARSTEQERKQQATVAALGYPPEYLQWVDAAAATRMAGHTAAYGGWWFPGGGWIQPRSLVAANLAQAGERARLKVSRHVERLWRDGEDWVASDEQGVELGRAPHLVLANAHDAGRLAEAEWLPLRAARGQVSHLPMAQLAPLGVVVCGQGYITPGIGGHAALGASFVVDDFDLALREEEHAENLKKLGLMLPGLADLPLSGAIEGRVSLRPVSLDRLPMVGALPATNRGEGYNLATLPRRDGLWMISGFGARGLVWSSLCAELLAARICNEVLPLEQELVDALDPARFVFHPSRTA